ncbi:MAG: carboxypeptidase regulatory-like domain-containing protein [Herpetosiphonaceae bacterium]|nr:carboxypeptidase regulatory-like domain-containing protein [Herpetosiphonaceae bacterium]
MTQRRWWLKLFVTAGLLMAMLLISARLSNAQAAQPSQPTIIPKEDEKYYEISNTGEVRRIPDSLGLSMKMTDEQGRTIYFVPAKEGTGKPNTSDPTPPPIPDRVKGGSIPTLPLIKATPSIPLGIVRGVVTTSTGKPIFEAGVATSPLSPGVAGDLMAIGTDKQGHYEKYLEPGRYQVSVYADHHAAQEKEVEVRANQSVQLDFQLIPD